MKGKIIYENMDEQVSHYEDLLIVEYSAKLTMSVIGESCIALIEDDIEKLVRERWEIKDSVSIRDYEFPMIHYNHDDAHPDVFLITVKSKTHTNRIAG